MNDQQLQQRAPSIFATEPWQERSAKYKFIPTIDVVNGLRDSGFQAVHAIQSRSRIYGKQDKVKHMLRFRHQNQFDLNNIAVNDNLPEIVLINSHDGSSAYKLFLGVFRLVCLNGLIVASSTINSIRAVHAGRASLIDGVIEQSNSLIKQAPHAFEQVKRWQGITLTPDQQLDFADQAKSASGSTLDLDLRYMLGARRMADAQSTNDGARGRSLWTTFNVVQENMKKGGIIGLSQTGRRMRSRAIKAVDADIRLNTKLWQLTEQTASQLADQFQSNNK